jgi:hypothetical protein
MPCDLSDLRRWWSGILNPITERYINLIIVGSKKHESVLQDSGIINGRQHLVLNKRYPTGGQQNLANLHLVPAGWSFPERDGVWSDGQHAEISFILPDAGEVFALKLSFTPFIPSPGYVQHYTIAIGGRHLLDMSCNQGRSYTKTLIIRRSDAPNINITLFIPNAIAPSEMDPLSSDTRELGIRLEDYSIELA